MEEKNISYYNLYTFKWTLKRFGYIQTILLELFDKLIYQNQSQFLLHPWSGNRTPFQSLLYYNRLGRILFGMKAFLALLTEEKLFKKEILLEGYDSIDISRKKGDYSMLYPFSPMNHDVELSISDSLSQKMQHSLQLALNMENKSYDKTQEWERVSELFSALFLQENYALNLKEIEGFRVSNQRCKEVFNDHFTYVDETMDYSKSYLKAIDLVLDFHRYAKVVNRELLATVTETPVGQSKFVYYRGQALSEKLLFHTMIVHDIISNINLNTPERKVIVDIGSGYGGLDRLLSFYAPNSCFVMVDLSETLLISSYYIEANFPDKRVALLSDIVDRLDDFETLFLEYDFIIIPPSVVQNIPNESVDLVMNSASLGFMEKEYVAFYLEEIERILRRLGHFYSLNKEYSDQLGRGYYEWDFKINYLTKYMAYNNRFSYTQWLGQKV